MALMFKPPALSIVIPAFNEARRIWGTLQTLRHSLTRLYTRWEIRVVDDGSEDETPAIVARAARQDGRVQLQREPHRGKGGAARAGLMAAHGTQRFLCDADLAMPIREIPRFLAHVPKTCDIAIGSREGRAARRVGEPAYRHRMGRIFNAVVRASVLPGIQDTQCGFKLFSARAAEAVFSAATIDGWAFDIEALVIARAQGWRIREVSIEWHYRDHSQVSVLRDPYRMLRDLWTIRANHRRGLYREPPERTSASRSSAATQGPRQADSADTSRSTARRGRA
jgi:dolichyl-phosphate beta-glucosyltransferase